MRIISRERDVIYEIREGKKYKEREVIRGMEGKRERGERAKER